MKDKEKKTDDNRRHCMEVEELMDGKMPFVTRHGVTAVVAVIILAMALLLSTDSVISELIRDMTDQILKQASAKTKLPGGI